MNRALLTGGRARWAGWAAALAMSVLLAGPVHAAAYLKFDQVTGESSAARFDGWSEVLGVSHKVSLTGGATQPGKPVFECVIRKRIDKATPELLRRCANGTVIERATFVYEEAGAVLYRVVFEEVRISSVRQTFSGPGDPVPVEEVSLSFKRAAWSSQEVGEGGEVVGGETTRFDDDTGKGEVKTRRPFRAEVAADREPGVLRLSCPVEKGHRYRLAMSTDLKGQWQTVLEFTATGDGVVERTVTNLPSVAFLRFEEVE